MNDMILQGLVIGVTLIVVSIEVIVLGRSVNAKLADVSSTLVGQIGEDAVSTALAPVHDFILSMGWSGCILGMMYTIATVLLGNGVSIVLPTMGQVATAAVAGVFLNEGLECAPNVYDGLVDKSWFRWSIIVIKWGMWSASYNVAGDKILQILRVVFGV